MPNITYCNLSTWFYVYVADMVVIRSLNALTELATQGCPQLGSINNHQSSEVQLRFKLS